MLFYTVALEALLLENRQSSSLGHGLEWRAAWVLGKSPKARLQIRRQIRTLYRLRSQIVHNGSIDILASDTRNARFLALNCIVNVLLLDELRHASSEDSFIQWFDTRMAGGSETTNDGLSQSD